MLNSFKYRHAAMRRHPYHSRRVVGDNIEKVTLANAATNEATIVLEDRRF